MTLSIRPAVREDTPTLERLMARAIDQNQRAHLSEEQIASSRAIMGLDRTLIDDGTYFVVHADGAVAGCGGWSRRATLYGGDHSTGRNEELLDPERDPARIRAMYTHPDFTRRGVGRLIVETCEHAAAAEGFTRLSLMATLSGLSLYLDCGFQPVERVTDDRGGTPVPLVHMEKHLEPAD